MKLVLVSALIATAAVVTVSGQRPAAVTGLTAEHHAAGEPELQASMTAGAAHAAVESRVTTGAPYAGDATTEFIQILSDGNRISRKSVTRTFRDSQGRTRREQTTINWAAGAETVSISIVDPVAHTSFVLDPENRIAYRHHGVIVMPAVVPPSGRGGSAGAVGGGRGRGAAPPSAAPTMPLGHATVERRRHTEAEGAAGQGRTIENLGQQIIEGVMAEGTRTTTIIPGGAIGNVQAIRIISEQWFSPDLQVLVMTRHSDPRTGETTYRLSNIVRGEQDRSLFEVPADYTVKEQRSFVR